MSNPGFEEGLAHWGVLAEFKGQASVVSTAVHSGDKAVKVDASTKNNTPFVTYSTDVAGGAVYQFTVWARVAPGSPAVQAAVKMESYSATRNNAGWYSRVDLPADGSWQLITSEHRMPSDTIRCAFLLRVFGPSAVIFDDAKLVKVSSSPEVSVLSPTKLAVDPAEKQQVAYQVSLRQKWDKETPPRIIAHIKPFEYAAADVKAFSIPTAVSQLEDAYQYKATFTLPALAPVDYTVDFEYQLKGQNLSTTFPAYIFTTVAHRQPKNLTDNGTILWHGKPFFPIGMYHPGQYYQLLAENGFNTVQGTATLNLEAFKAKLDLAQKYGLAVDVPLYRGMKVQANLPNSLEKVKLFADHPAILNWKILDEPHIRQEGSAAIHVPEAYRALKAADPVHPIELTLNSPATQKFWSQFCDIVQADSYPLPRFPLTQVADAIGTASRVTQPWQNVSAVLQSGWVIDLHNQPSVAQARSMVYLALIEGAKGIWWYSMRESSGWDLTKTPLWPHMKAINAEIKVLSEPIMLGHTVKGISCNQESVYFRAFEYQDKTYLLVTNPGDKPLQTTFTLPGAYQSSCLLKDGVQKDIQNGKLNITLQGIDSRTYILQK